MEVKESKQGRKKARKQASKEGRKEEKASKQERKRKQARKKASKQARKKEKASKQDRQTCEKLFVFVENLSNGVRIPKGKVQQGKASIVPFEKF